MMMISLLYLIGFLDLACLGERTSPTGGADFPPFPFYWADLEAPLKRAK
jgi:hypothetical protein